MRAWRGALREKKKEIENNNMSRARKKLAVLENNRQYCHASA